MRQRRPRISLDSRRWRFDVAREGPENISFLKVFIQVTTIARIASAAIEESVLAFVLVKILSYLAINVYQRRSLALVFEQVGHQPGKRRFERQDRSNLLSQSLRGHWVFSKLKRDVDDFFRFDGNALS